jgi:phosphoglycolate phosphatase
VEQFDLVVFDWDGTLVDSTAAIAEAIRQSAHDLGLQVPTRRQASHVIGLGLHDALRLAVPDLTQDRLPAFIDRYRVHYLQRNAELQPFEGISELLEELAGAGQRMGIATGKSRSGLNQALRDVGWSRHFTISRCADEGIPKPDPWMLNDICRELQIASERTVMIGDTTHDLAMARDAGAHAVAVLYGAHEPEDLRAFGTQTCVESVAALRQWILPRCSARSTQRSQ